MEIMDRRQRKTRNAIFTAFIQLLSEKNVNSITVGEIIERADVGRATFYAHFETKDFLIKELCEELFCHIFDAQNNEFDHKHLFECDNHGSVFQHLFSHLRKNDNHILDLLSSQNNSLFLEYFKSGLKELIENQEDVIEFHKKADIPYDFYVNHVCATFVETVLWWINNKMAQSEDEITRYFLSVINA